MYLFFVHVPPFVLFVNFFIVPRRDCRLSYSAYYVLLVVWYPLLYGCKCTHYLLWYVVEVESPFSRASIGMYLLIFASHHTFTGQVFCGIVLEPLKWSSSLLKISTTCEKELQGDGFLMPKVSFTMRHERNYIPTPKAVGIENGRNLVWDSNGAHLFSKRVTHFCGYIQICNIANACVSRPHTGVYIRKKKRKVEPQIYSNYYGSLFLLFLLTNLNSAEKGPPPTFDSNSIFVQHFAVAGLLCFENTRCEACRHPVTLGICLLEYIPRCSFSCPKGVRIHGRSSFQRVLETSGALPELHNFLGCPCPQWAHSLIWAIF